ncbi:MAG: hypothetical protein WCO18_00100 [bacterium]
MLVFIQNMTVIYTFLCCLSVFPTGDSFPKEIARTGEKAVRIGQNTRGVQFRIDKRIVTVPHNVVEEILDKQEIPS